MKLSKVLRVLQFLINVLIIKVQSDSDIKTLVNFFENHPTNPRILHLGKKLLVMEIRVDVLGSSFDNSYNRNLYEKTAFIENDLFKLRNEIYNVRCVQNFSMYEESVKKLKKLCVILLNQVLHIKILMAFVGKKFFFDDIIKAVKNDQFPEGEQILEYLDDSPVTTENLVQKIYNRSTESITTLIKFSNFLSTIDPSVKVIKALYKEINSSDDVSAFKMINFIKLLDSDVFNQTNSAIIEYPEANYLYSNIKNSCFTIKDESIKVLEMEMIRNPFGLKETVNTFLDQLYKFNKTLSNEILYSVFDRIHGNISINEILDNIFSKCSLAQQSDAFVYMYNKMKSFQELKSSIMKLTEYIFNLISSNPSVALQDIWNKLPTDIKYLYSVKRVYLRNAEVDEYLNAASDNLINGVHRRYVFTWTPIGKLCRSCQWNIDHKFGSKDFYFVNNEHQNEYLYASEDGMDIWNRYAFTWMLKEKVDSNKSAWNIEPAENYIQIRNVFNKQLLCVTFQKYTPIYRYVFTLEDKFRGFERSCQWKLIPSI